MKKADQTIVDMWSINNHERLQLPQIIKCYFSNPWVTLPRITLLILDLCNDTWRTETPRCWLCFSSWPGSAESPAAYRADCENSPQNPNASSCCVRGCFTVSIFGRSKQSSLFLCETYGPLTPVTLSDTSSAGYSLRTRSIWESSKLH